jgi:hypothetical protein
MSKHVNQRICVALQSAAEILVVRLTDQHYVFRLTQRSFVAIFQTLLASMKSITSCLFVKNLKLEVKM